MKVFIVLAVAVACASGQILLNSPWALPRAVIPAATHVVSPVTATQHHAQDELGQYTYGYSGGPSAKIESKTLDGVTRGGYSYIDANGLLQTVNYVSDALGFRVAATNLPVAPAAPLATLPGPLPVAPAPVAETPEVAQARAEHLAAHAKAAAAAAAAPDN